MGYGYTPKPVNLAKNSYQSILSKYTSKSIFLFVEMERIFKIKQVSNCYLRCFV
jgi:hypothetical protein